MYCWQWNYIDETSWGDCARFLKIRSLCGVLLQDVFGTSPSRFLTRPCIFTGVLEHVWSSSKTCRRGKARSSTFGFISTLGELVFLFCRFCL
jgi:Niemann-Pick C1 protein